MFNRLQLLKKAAELGRIPHALLFYGPDSERKLIFAFELVKLVNGPQALEGVRPDLVIIEPGEEKEIKIAQIRELHSKLSLKSYLAPFKIAIIKQAHCLNQETQSAFLKLLEEPRGKTIFILITEYPGMLLPTILSRVERLRFYSPLKRACVREEAEKISKIARSDLGKRFQYAKELSEDPQNLKKILESWLYYFRETLLSNPSQLRLRPRFAKATPGEQGFGLRLDEVGLRPDEVGGQAKIIKILKTIQTTHFLLSTTNVNPRLALEILMLEF